MSNDNMYLYDEVYMVHQEGECPSTVTLFRKHKDALACVAEYIVMQLRKRVP
jgi:hypothetical protein